MARICKIIKKCKNKSETNLVKCNVCNTNWIHQECIGTLLLSFGEDVKEEITQSFCGKRCWNKATKPAPPTKAANKEKHNFWHNDGPTPDINSLSVLLDWITHEGNYTKWKGGLLRSGVTKKTLAEQILAKIKAKGITVDRTAKDVTQKILVMEQNFKKAIDFLDGTGAGITNEQSLRAAVKKICPNYYELESIMSDRKLSRPFEEPKNIQVPKNDQSPTASSSKRSSRHLSIKDQVRKKAATAPFGINVKRGQLPFEGEVIEARREIKARKLEAEARQKEAETKFAFDTAMIKKCEAEVKLIDIEVKCKLLLKRKELLDAGVSQEDIDTVLPLK